MENKEYSWKQFLIHYSIGISIIIVAFTVGLLAAYILLSGDNITTSSILVSVLIGVVVTVSIIMVITIFVVLIVAIKIRDEIKSESGVFEMKSSEPPR